VRSILPIVCTVLLSCLVGTTSKAGCFRGKPSPQCQSFWITEIGLGFRLNNQQYDQYGTARLYVDFGYMKNVSPRDAWGGTLFASTEDERAQMGLRLRYRRWLSSKSALDLSPGLLLIGGGNIDYPGFIGSASLSLWDWIVFSLQIEMVKQRGGWYSFTGWEPASASRTSYYAGVSLGSYGGIAGTVGVIVLIGIIAVTWTGYE